MNTAPINSLIDASCASQALDDTMPDTGQDWLPTRQIHGLPLAWILEGYTIDETAEGILSNAGIEAEG